MALSDLAMPLVRCLDPEKAHRLTIRALQSGLGPRMGPLNSSRLRQTISGLDFPNPVGLAAGFDKDAEVPRGCFNLGFGFVEIGTVTPRPQPGNPKPRLFRLTEDRAVINRMGFNNGGMEATERRLATLRQRKLPGPLGVNIGKNKDTEAAEVDYALCTKSLAPFADYLTINVSSPNTPGLRTLQSTDALTSLVRAVREEAPSGLPIFVKLAPDLAEEDLENLAGFAADTDIAGLILTNTTISRPETLASSSRDEAGGLSGRPLFAASTEVLRQMFRLTHGKVPLIGVGGIGSAEDAYTKIKAGACLVQLYSALVFEGPGLVSKITQGLERRLERDGVANIHDVVGQESQ